MGNHLVTIVKTSKEPNNCTLSSRGVYAKIVISLVCIASVGRGMSKLLVQTYGLGDRLYHSL